MSKPTISPTYMVDSKLHWNDFKKALKDNAMAWGFRQWFNTTVYGGPKWIELVKLGLKMKQEEDDEQMPDLELEDQPAQPAERAQPAQPAERAQPAQPAQPRRNQGEEEEEVKRPAPAVADPVEVKNTLMPEAIMKIMGYTPSEVDYFQASTRFVNVLTGMLETSKQGVARQKLWNWMVKSLHGPRPTPGSYYYLVEQVDHSDVAALYQQLIRVIDTPTMVSQADDLAAVFLLPFDPRSQDIFNYYGEVKKLVKRVHDLNPLLPEESRIKLPDTIVRALLLRAMKTVPLYKTVLDSFIIRKPEEWKDC